MLAIKNRFRHGKMIFQRFSGWMTAALPRCVRQCEFSPLPVLFVLVLLLSGCGAPGPRAFLKGRQLLERGDYAAAAAELKIAATLLSTNAMAWDYYGVALQHAGQPADAVLAYQNALKYDRDLMEAHYNLGWLWLEENKPDVAKAEFTAYTLRRNNAPEGWLMLGKAQLRSGETLLAEKSFSTAHYLSPTNAEALNGLGLASIQRGRPNDAEKFFAAAVKNQPDYAPALLNLATIQLQYLHENAEALNNYREYLALEPRPADSDTVNALVKNLEQGQPVLAVNTPPPIETRSPAPPPVTYETKPPPVAKTEKTTSPTHTNHPVVAQKPRQNAVNAYNPPGQVVVVQPQQEITTTPAEPGPPPAPKPSVWHKLNPAHWFDTSSQQNGNIESGVTPLPPVGSVQPAQNPAPVQMEGGPVVPPLKPVKIVPPAPPTFPRYVYLSPRKPYAGDRKAASRAFDEAQDFERKQDFQEAMSAYQRAAELDPAWFEAQYNYGVMAYREEGYNQALGAYEMALAIQPGSADARYDFALALKAEGYITDAANELKKVVAERPNEVRAHLALGNLYAQPMRDPAQARREYLRVLELDPHNPQAADIQFWLSDNPQ